MYISIYGYAYVAQAGPKQPITEGDLGLLIFLPPLAECWEHRHALPCTIDAILGIGPKALYVPDTLQTGLQPSLLPPYF